MSERRIGFRGARALFAGTGLLLLPSIALACGVCFDDGIKERSWGILPGIVGVALGLALEAIVSRATSRWTDIEPEWPRSWTVVAVVLLTLLILFVMFGAALSLLAFSLLMGVPLVRSVVRAGSRRRVVNGLRVGAVLAVGGVFIVAFRPARQPTERLVALARSVAFSAFHRGGDQPASWLDRAIVARPDAIPVIEEALRQVTREDGDEMYLPVLLRLHALAGGSVNVRRPLCARTSQREWKHELSAEALARTCPPPDGPQPDD